MTHKKRCFAIILMALLFSMMGYSIAVIANDKADINNVFEIVANNTDLAPGMGTGERVTNVNYTNTNYPIQILLYSHAQNVSQTTDIELFVNGVMVSAVSSKPVGSAEQNNKSIVMIIPKNSTYRALFLNYHHYEWREYPILSGKNGTLNLTNIYNNYTNISSYNLTYQNHIYNYSNPHLTTLEEVRLQNDYYGGDFKPNGDIVFNNTDSCIYNQNIFQQIICLNGSKIVQQININSTLSLSWIGNSSKSGGINGIYNYVSNISNNSEKSEFYITKENITLNPLIYTSNSNKPFKHISNPIDNDDATNKQYVDTHYVNKTGDNTTGLFRFNQYIVTPPSLVSSMTPTMYIVDDKDSIAGVVMGNNNSGINSDFRFIIQNNLKSNYLAFAYPGDGATASLFGRVKNTSAYLFTNKNTKSLNMTIGTIADDSLIFGTQNNERMVIEGNGQIKIPALPDTKITALCIDANEKIYRSTNSSSNYLTC